MIDDQTSNLEIFPLHRWSNADPVALGNQLVQIVEQEGTLDARHMLLVSRQRALKARLAASGVPEALWRQVLGAWTNDVYDEEQRALREQMAK